VKLKLLVAATFVEMDVQLVRFVET